MVPRIHRQRRWRRLADGVLGRATGEVRVMRSSAGARTKNASAWCPERHGPGLDHARPRVVARRLAHGRSWRVETAVRSAAVPTIASTTMTVVVVGGRGTRNREDLGAEMVELEPELELSSVGAEANWRGAPAASSACWAAVLACSLS